MSCFDPEPTVNELVEFLQEEEVRTDQVRAFCGTGFAKICSFWTPTSR